MEKKKIFIFMEGNIDLQIITAFIAHVYGFEKPKDFKGEVTITSEHKDIEITLKTLSGGGLSGYSAIEHTERQEDIKEYTEKGYQCFVILDADNEQKNAKNGGYKQRKQWLENVIQKNNLSLDFFLLPNNQGDGDLEVLLRRSLAIEQQGIITCIEQFNNCLETYKQNPSLKRQQNKELLYETCYKVFKNFKFDYDNNTFEDFKKWLDTIICYP
jgi:hypothetical protein